MFECLNLLHHGGDVMSSAAVLPMSTECQNMPRCHGECEFRGFGVCWKVERYKAKNLARPIDKRSYVPVPGSMSVNDPVVYIFLSVHDGINHDLTQPH